MEYTQFSPNQLMALGWWNDPRHQERDAILCDGSIRSGKTLSMSVGFVLWSMTRFDRQNFALCGKTIESLRRNVILQLPHLLEGLFSLTERRSENLLTLSAGGKENRYFLFGGRDESSYALIQGMTLAGVLFDEAALMPRSFVEQALARCSVEGSRFWFNCNPESPEHWFYKEWVLKAEEKNALRLHFTMADNLSLSSSVRKRYEGLYAGVFYERYILGRWAVAEGLVYPMFDAAKHITDTLPNSGGWYVSIDYGTLNPCSMGLWRVSDGVACRVKEYYHSGRDTHEQRTDEEYYAELEKLAGGNLIQYVVVDPSAASFIECIRRHGRFTVRKADNTVLDGIRRTGTLLTAGRLLFSRDCAASVREFGLYSWDAKAQEDKPLKENDHAMDDIRYFVSTILRREFKWVEWNGGQ